MIIRIHRRRFSTILPSGEKVERELSPVEREFVNLKQTHFSRLGLYRKENTNEATLYKLFQMAQPQNKLDYSACVFAMNHFYNFGVGLEQYDITNRWLALAIEAGRINEAVQIIKLWNTWLRSPPSIELVEIVIQMVRLEQSRDMLKTIRECWQLPLSPQAYTCVISKELALSASDARSIIEAYSVWKDAMLMDVILSSSIHSSLSDSLQRVGELEKANEVALMRDQQSIDGLDDF